MSVLCRNWVAVSEICQTAGIMNPLKFSLYLNWAQNSYLFQASREVVREILDSAPGTLGNLMFSNVFKFIV